MTAQYLSEKHSTCGTIRLGVITTMVVFVSLISLANVLPTLTAYLSGNRAMWRIARTAMASAAAAWLTCGILMSL
jgi:hypothetical protein